MVQISFRISRGVDQMAATDLTSFARGLLGKTDVRQPRGTLAWGVQVAEMLGLVLAPVEVKFLI
jgi:hypothetical protein